MTQPNISPFNRDKAHRLLHHGNCSGEFKPKYIGSDYFKFYHKPCLNKPNYGFCDIIAVLIDNQGRIVFNLKCEDCGAIDALKIGAPLEVFHLSPKLKNRVNKHWWDDL